jgi:putative ABC transport system permease protein
MTMTRVFIHLVSRLVPASLREQWREEWLAELSAQPRKFDRRALGALQDALSLLHASRTSGPAFTKAPAGRPRDFGTRLRLGYGMQAPGLRDFGTSGLRDDLRLSLRLARRHPGHSALTVVVVALGVGLMTAVLSIGYAVFLKPWPIHEPDRVAFVFRNNAFGLATGRLNEHTPDYDVVAQNSAIAAVAGFQHFFPEITIDGITERRHAGELVTAAYFDVIGIKPRLGRTFLAEEDTPANADLGIVISYRMWEQRFDGRADVVGTRIGVGDKVATVIGVLSPGFYGLSSAYSQRDWWMLARPFRNVQPAATVIRLTPGASTSQAAAALAGYGLHVNELERAKGFGSPAPEGKPVFEVIPANQMRTPMTPSEILVPRRFMWGLIAVVGMVLAIAVASIAGLCVARGFDRESEVATRRVLGVTTWRLGRQLVIEQLLLTIAGGALASAVAWNLVELTTQIVPEQYLIPAELDWHLFAVAFLASLTIGVCVSVAPLRHALRIDLLQALAGASATASTPASRLGLVSLTPQVTLAVILLVTAGVHVKALLALNIADLGYTIDGRVIMEVNTSGGILSDTPLPSAERRTLLPRLSALTDTWPGVQAGFTESLPLLAVARANLASSEASVKNHKPDAIGISRRLISPGGLGALNMTLVAGRDFTQQEYEWQSPVAIVSERFVRQLWPSSSPIGQRFMLHGPMNQGDLTQGDWAAHGTWVEVIGVVSDVTPLVRSQREAFPVYTLTGSPFRVHVVVAGTSDPEMLGRIRDDIQTLDPTMRVTSIQPMQATADDLLRPRRTAATFLGVCGLAGLALACIGLYAHVALSVARRRREFGIRSALGASAGSLVMHIVRDHARIALLGAALGLGGAVATLRLSSRVVRDVPTSDVTTFVVVPLVLVGVCLLACVLPARRAGMVDPVSTLKA